jgi:hypothetical protein
VVDQQVDPRAPHERDEALEHVPIAVRVVAVVGIAAGIGFAVVGPWLLAAMAL